MTSETSSSSERGRVVGFVTDTGPGNKTLGPVVDARVDVYGPFEASPRRTPDAPPRSAQTDVTGGYTIENLDPGHYWAICEAFTRTGRQPKGHAFQVEPGGSTRQDLQLEVGLQLSATIQAASGDRDNELDTSSFVEAGTPIKLRANYSHDLMKQTLLKFAASQGTLIPIPNSPDEMMLITSGVSGAVDLWANIAEANSPNITVATSVMVLPAKTQPISGQIGVTLQRSASIPTPDLGLWAAIRTHEKAISFGGIGTGVGGLKGYQGFIEQVLCRGPNGLAVPTDPCERHPGVELLGEKSALAKQLPLHGMAAYELLKTATEIFLLWNCGVAIRTADSWGNPLTTAEEESARTGLPVGQVISMLANFLGSNRLPYIERIVRTAFPGYVSGNSVFCTSVLSQRVDCVCLIELIWSYWHEEAMLVQSMNAISRRFQNVRGMGDRDPLAHVTIDPLRPLNNLLWGYVQDEQNRLTVNRRGAEYDHEYGIALRGKAIQALRPADSRSKFLEGFHNLLHLCSIFYKEDNDTTVIADGFPLLNALKEVHLLLAQGAHNQFGDLPWTARVEMLMQQWMLARPEMRDFLQSRPMVPYTEAWMPQVDTMKTLQGWTDVTVTHFHDLAVFGEQILLSVRYGDWIALNDENHAKNWARYWRPEIQGYIHAYRTATGIDLTNPDTVDYTMPAVHLQKRLALQRTR
ncbi:carboxypeptidase-like regulatory domain-containing protein [Bradyrhizobium sp. Ai1a-2]|uniref:carboxypeptidase-like regulatory domain-containing protein n=1 Tax=Bradyrhizobium sp. Ai1a-2 TaxID=196490 RepID=UPI001267D98F|nr:carboxypeptidase-like regulatory domain-containing protein [Bradyrhizobium sp. Ai1a-2]